MSAENMGAFASENKIGVGAHSVVSSTASTTTAAGTNGMAGTGDVHECSVPASCVPGVQPDLANAERFLDAFGDEYHCFQAFDDRGADKSLARTIHGTLQERGPELTQLNERGAGIFVTPNAIAPGQRRLAKNATRVRALFVDADKPEDIPEIERRIAQLGLQPSIVVESSPGKFHYYWRTDNFPLDGFKRAQQRIAKLLGTDASVCDPSRVMRLPGFIHQKGQPWRTRLVCVR